MKESEFWLLMLLILGGVAFGIAIAGCGSPQSIPGEYVYVDEIDLPEKFKASEFPRITIDGVRLWIDPNMPGYRSVQFNCPVAWMDFGGDRSLSDGTDFRSEDESLYKEFANVDGDIMVRHREGVIQIMENRQWRPVKPGDKLRPSAAEAMLPLEAITGNSPELKQRIGLSDYWVFNGQAGWVFCEPPSSSY